MIYADQRWIGDHGIGRFARNVLDGLDYRPIPLREHPASALDSWRLARCLRYLPDVELFFSPGYNAPPGHSIPFVFTLHDLNHIDRPENSNLAKRIYYATYLRRACHRATRVVTVSEFSRRRITEWAGVSADKVINVKLGVDDAFRPDGEKYQLPYPYVLCVSNRKLHKNESRTLRAFADAQLPESLRLVMTGNATAALSAEIEQLGLMQRVMFLGRVAEIDLPKLYRGALSLLFVSLYEGFGLPVLEAMACGTPVLTSNVSALPEIAGDAALLSDPTSVGEITAKLERVVTDMSLRAVLRERGLTRASRFNWSNTVAAVRGILLESVGRAQ